jgi:hypothetical protein
MACQIDFFHVDIVMRRRVDVLFFIDLDRRKASPHVTGSLRRMKLADGSAHT